MTEKYLLKDDNEEFRVLETLAEADRFNWRKIWLITIDEPLGRAEVKEAIEKHKRQKAECDRLEKIAQLKKELAKLEKPS